MKGSSKKRTPVRGVYFEKDLVDEILNEEHKTAANKITKKQSWTNGTSTMAQDQERFGFDVQFSALVYNFNNIF